jgi:hypothetical protein
MLKQDARTNARQQKQPAWLAVIRAQLHAQSRAWILLKLALRLAPTSQRDRIKLLLNQRAAHVWPAILLRKSAIPDLKLHT